MLRIMHWPFAYIKYVVYIKYLTFFMHLKSDVSWFQLLIVVHIMQLFPAGMFKYVD